MITKKIKTNGAVRKFRDAQAMIDVAVFTLERATKLFEEVKDYYAGMHLEMFAAKKYPKKKVR